MKMRFFGSFVFGSLALAAMNGCGAEDPQPSNESGETGRAAMALSSTDIDGNVFCASGTIEIRRGASGGPLVASIPTNCGIPSHSVVLLPGNYNVVVTGLTCTYTPSPDGGAGAPVFANSCVQNPNPQVFQVSVGQTEPVPISIVYSFVGQAPITVLFGVGAGNITLDPEPLVTFMCGVTVLGQSSSCPAGSTCLDLALNGLDLPDGGATFLPTACYESCDFVEGDANGGTVGFPECPALDVCIPALPLNSIPVEMDLDLVPGVCVLATSMPAP